LPHYSRRGINVFIAGWFIHIVCPVIFGTHEGSFAIPAGPARQCVAALILGCTASGLRRSRESYREFIMSDFAPLGSYSSLDELGPTETTWHPFAYRTQARTALRQAQRPQQQQQQAAETRVCEPA
jgi:hypothetical protein